MWPFRKKPALPLPDDVIVGDDRARFDPSLELWEFEIEGVEFTLADRNFDRSAFPWARAALTDIRRLEGEIDNRVLAQLDGWPFNKAARQLLSVSLDDYASEGQIDLAYTGDESWGDYGVNVILADGKVVDVHGGD